MVSCRLHRTKQANNGVSEFSTHLLDVLKNHVAVAVKGLDSGQQLLVVSAADKNLCMVLDGLLKDRQWSCVELFLLQSAELLLVHLAFWLGGAIEESTRRRTRVSTADWLTIVHHNCSASLMVHEQVSIVSILITIVLLDGKYGEYRMFLDRLQRMKCTS